MSRLLKFNYYYGVEAEQFSFYRVPRLLIKDERFKGLSSDAKFLYGLMLDRMALSMKNRWLDDENRAYIIYVKNFASIPKKESGRESTNTDVSTEVKNLYFRKERNFTSESKETELLEVKKTDFKRENNFTSGSKETELLEVKEIDPNYNNTNYNNQNYINVSYINPINQSAGNVDKPGTEKKADTMDMIDETNTYMELIRDNLEYAHHMKYDQCDDKEMYEEIYETVCDVVCVKRKTIRINGEDYPYEFVKSRFLKLNSSHAEYVMSCMRETISKITNIRAYLITALYNAPSTINNYYQQEVQHDMYGRGWAEKGIT